VHSNQFHRHVTFYSHLKSKVDNILTKDTDGINLNIDYTSIASTSHTRLNLSPTHLKYSVLQKKNEYINIW
jgi:hypothetical protein